MEYISFGNDCSIAFQLQQYNLRNYAYPFDWLLIPNLIDIINLINNDFINFISQDYLQFKNTSANFPLINDTWNDKYTDMYRVKHKLYNIQFLHDFNINYNIDNIKEKYNRRIKRFDEIMKNKNIKKLLYRIGSKKDNIDLLIKTFNNKNYTNYQINFKSFDEINKSDTWKRENFDWLNWFQKN